MKSWTLTAIALLFGILSYAQSHSWNYTLSGTVTDSLTKEPLVGVLVATSKTGVVTDENGFYSLSNLRNQDVVRFMYTGYETFTKVIDGAHENPFDVQLKLKENELGIVVVSAGKYEQSLGEVTVSMEVIRPALVQDKNVTAIDQVLQQTPGVSIVDDEPQIRCGSGFSFGAGSRVQVLVDDLPMISGDAGKPSWSFLPIENLSQIEIIKGASSVLYGSSALSGVINLRTAYPTTTPKTRVQIYHGIYSDPQSDSARYWEKNAMISGFNFLHARQIKNVDLVIGGNFAGDDGHLGPIVGASTTAGYDPFSVDRFDAEKRGRINVNFNVRSKRVSGLQYGVNANLSNSESLATLIWENTSTGLYSAYDGAATRTKQQLYAIDPYVIYYTKNGGKHSLRNRYQSLTNDNDNNQGNSSEVYYSEYQYQQNWSTRGINGLTTTLGVVNIYTEAVGELFIGGNADGRNNAANQAAFLQLDQKIGERINLSGGVRYEHFRINNDSEGKPVFRAGANYQIHQATYLRASFGQGFRFPSIAEKFIVTSLGAIKIFANPDIKAESSYNAEIGIKQGFKIGEFKGFADIAVFHQEYENFIEFTFGQWDPNPTISNQFGLGFKSINTGSARVQGVEASIMGEGKVGPMKIQLLAGYTYTRPVSTSPDYVYGSTPAAPNNPFVIEEFAQASYLTTSSDPTNNILKYRLQHLVRVDVGASWRAINAGVSVRYNSHMQNIDGAFEQLEEALPGVFNPGIRNWRSNNTGGDYVLDARVGYTFKKIHRISLVMSNVLNRQYAIRPLAIEEPRVTTIQYAIEF